MPLELDDPAIVLAALKESIQPNYAKQTAAARELFKAVAEASNVAGLQARALDAQPGNAPMLRVWFGNAPNAEFIFSGEICYLECTQRGAAAHLKRPTPGGEAVIELKYNSAGDGSFEGVDQFGRRYSAEKVLVALIAEKMRS